MANWLTKIYFNIKLSILLAIQEKLLMAIYIDNFRTVIQKSITLLIMVNQVGYGCTKVEINVEKNYMKKVKKK